MTTRRTMLAAGALSTLGLSTGALLTSCSSKASGGDDSSSGPPEGDLTVWMYPIMDDSVAKTFWQKVSSGFTEKYPDVNLSIEQQSWDGRQEKITTALTTGTGFDIVLLGPDQIPQYVAQSALAKLDDLMPEGTADRIVPSARKYLTLDGGLYGVPIYYEVTSAIYNKEILDKAGISDLPQTWDALGSAVEKLSPLDVAALTYFGNPETTLNMTFYPLLWQHGADAFDEQGAVTIDSPGCVETLQFLLDLQKRGGLQPGAASEKNAFDTSSFVKGKSAVVYGANPAALATVQKLMGAEVAVGGLPFSDVKMATDGTPGALVVSAKSEVKSAAAAFIDYMIEPSMAKEISRVTMLFPGVTDAEVGFSSTNTQNYMEAMKVARPGYMNTEARSLMPMFASHIQAALLGKADAKTALSKAADEARRSG